MGKRQGSNRGLPRWWRGAKKRDDIDGSEIYTHDGSLFRQRGLNVSKANFDTLTDLEREEQKKT